MNIYIYDWSYEVIQDTTCIRIFGLNKENETVMLNVYGFLPYIYVELPPGRTWDKQERRSVKDGINNELNKGMIRPPVAYKKRKKRLLYYVQHEDRTFLQCWFATNDKFRNIATAIGKEIECPGLGRVRMRVHEESATPILQLATTQHIPMSGWITFDGAPVDVNNLCDHEFDVEYTTLAPLTDPTLTNPTPLVLSFDLEVYSSNPNKMPTARCREDAIFQISCVFWKQGSSNYDKYLLSLGSPDPHLVGDDVQCLAYKDEVGLLIGFIQLVMKQNPQVVTGYNILGFDMPYLIERVAKIGDGENLTHNGVDFESLTDFLFSFGMVRDKICPEIRTSWSSSAYGSQTFRYIAADGRIFVDLLVLARREFKFSNYKLDTVASHFIKANKDPLSAADIFRGYEEIGTGENKRLSEVGKYCVQDSVLVARLFDVLDTWFGIMEMAAVCHIPASYVYTKGQQIKVFSQVYQFCHDNNIVVESNGYTPKEGEEYQGATVIEPDPGIYNYVIPFDFSSLYPTTMIAYNIDYSTLIRDTDTSWSPDDYHHITWTDEDTHKTHSYKFLKGPKGVLPSIIVHLLDARKQTRKHIKELKRELSTTADKKQLSTRINILNKRQLSYKVSCNSVHADTPIPCLIDGQVQYRSIETLARGTWVHANEEQEIALPLRGVQVWSDRGFTPVHYVMRHKMRETDKLVTVQTRTGYVQCTEDHSLLHPDGNPVKPKDLNLGDALMHTRLPLPRDTPKSYKKPSQLKTQTEKDAFQDGIAFARGTLRDTHRVLQEPLAIRLAFFLGIQSVECTFTKQHLVRVAEYAYLLESIGQSCTFIFHNDVCEFTFGSRESGGVIARMTRDTAGVGTYVYDIETENHHFAAGVGSMVVHNSIYGSLGVKRGYLPFMPGAMCTTAMGRYSLHTAANYLQHKCGATLVYGDTDSCYVRFPRVPKEQLWTHAREVERYIEEQEVFPAPMKLEFEEAVYNPFLILKKKHYMYKTYNEDGTQGDTIGKKGVLLARRDNSAFVRHIYETTVDLLFRQLPLPDVLYHLVSELNRCCSGSMPYTDFIITKSVKSLSEYKVKPLPDDPVKRSKRLQSLGCTTEKEYAIRAVPAQVQLAERMKNRGIRVDPGQRIEYVVTTNGGLKAKLFDKIEDPVYQQRHSSILHIDYLYYVHMTIIPVDQLLRIVFKEDDHMKWQYKARVRKYDTLRELRHVFQPRITFE